MTAKEAYQKMRSYFSKPGAVLARKGPQCQYKTPDGRKCAVGVLIPAALYRPEMEGQGFEDLYANLQGIVDYEEDDDELSWGLSTKEAQKLLAIFDDDPAKHDLLDAAQHLHDEAALNAEHFVRLLDDYARKNNLA